MGDRANIYVIEQTYSKNEEGKWEPEPVEEAAKRGIYFYTHWSGYEWPEELRKALVAGKGRWGDDAYLIRIVASNIFADIHGDETGGGISRRRRDNEHTIIILSVTDQHVAFAKEGDEQDPSKWFAKMTFASFVGQTLANYPGGEG